MQKLTESHPLWQLYIRFHTNDLSPEERTIAKAWLLDLHYGNWDTSAADKLINARNFNHDHA